MSKIEQHPITKRYLEVIDHLIDKQIVKNLADFCKRVDFNIQSMSQIKRGERNVTIELLSKLFTTFNGNPVYLLSGTGDKVIQSKNQNDLNEPEARYNIGKGADRTIKLLEELLEDKNR